MAPSAILRAHLALSILPILPILFILSIVSIPSGRILSCTPERLAEAASLDIARSPVHLAAIALP